MCGRAEGETEGNEEGEEGREVVSVWAWRECVCYVCVCVVWCCILMGRVGLGELGFVRFQSDVARHCVIFNSEWVL